MTNEEEKGKRLKDFLGRISDEDRQKMQALAERHERLIDLIP